MAERIPQSTTIRVPFQAFLTTTHFAPATGLTIAITISKNGGAYANPSGGATNAVEIGNGSYYVDLSTTDTNTLGPLFVLGTAATMDNVNVLYNVVDATNAGLSNLDAPISGRMATYTQPAGFLAATFPSGTIANTTNITAGTITNVGTVTTAVNLTNAPIVGDLTAAMKSSVTTAATAATPTVAGVKGGVTVQLNNDKTGYSLTPAQVAAINSPSVQVANPDTFLTDLTKARQGG